MATSIAGTKRSVFAIEFEREVARLLRAAREQRRYTRETLVDRTGGLVSPPMISSYENGTRSLKITTLAILLAALNVDIYEFIALAESNIGGRPNKCPAIDAKKMLNDDDPRFDAIRRWWTVVNSQSLTPRRVIALTPNVIATLAQLCQVQSDELVQELRAANLLM